MNIQLNFSYIFNAIFRKWKADVECSSNGHVGSSHQDVCKGHISALKINLSNEAIVDSSVTSPKVATRCDIGKL